MFLEAYFSEDVPFSNFFRILACSIGICLPSHFLILQSEKTKQPPEVVFKKNTFLEILQSLQQYTCAIVYLTIVGRYPFKRGKTLE